MADEDELPEVQPPNDGVPTNVFDAVQHPKVARAIATLAEAVNEVARGWAINEPARIKSRVRAFVMANLFGIAVLAGVGFLGWLKVLSNESTATLIGTLIGYWYGRERGK